MRSIEGAIDLERLTLT